MLVNKIGKIQSQVFKGFQYENTKIGETAMRFNYPYDYSKKNAHVEIFRVKKNDAIYGGYEVLADTPVARVKLENDGTSINFSDYGFEKEEAFAYRISIENEGTFTDTGVKSLDGNFTIVTRNGTTPKIHGAGYFAFPDSQKPGVRYYGFDEPNTGRINYSKELQKDAENTVRTFSNKLGGNLAGMEYSLNHLQKAGYKVIFANPIAGGDNKSSHHYWNKNNFQISDDMGNIENFASFVRKLYQKGMNYVYDGTFTSEGLEGIHFQYALRWGDKNPQSYYWFKMNDLKDTNIALGAIPKNKANLRHRVVNPPYIYNERTKEIEKNPIYDKNQETLFQIYDGSQVTTEQLRLLDSPIEAYKKIKSENPLAINSHDNTIINYVCEINPDEYLDRLILFSKMNSGSSNPIKLNSPEGTLLIAQFSNFKIDKKTEGGFVAWDANTDMAKMNYHISAYDEKISQSIVDRAERDYVKEMRERGAYEVQDIALQAARYWTGLVKDQQTLYTAQVLKGARSEEKIVELINKGLLPKESKLDNEIINNIINGYYNLEQKGVLDKDSVTLKSLMNLPLDTLELAENTVGVLSTSYFSNRAVNKETLGLTRFELLQQDNPHLVEPYSNVYLRMNTIFRQEIKDFTHKVLEKVNEESSEKLLDEFGDYTEYGEYVVDLIGSSIAKYALLKSFVGDKIKTKILPNGEITYDYKHLKEISTLKSLGIEGTSPTDEAEQLVNLIERNVKKLSKEDVEYVVKSIAKRIEGTSIESFRLAEAMVQAAGLGLSWRLDAAKDVMDQDAVRNGETSFDETWQNVIDFWKMFVQAVKKENPNSYIVAEITDMQELVRCSTSEKLNAYDDIPEGYKYRGVPDAMIKFYNETGITSEAAYSYFFTDIIKVFSAEFEEGTKNDDPSRAHSFIYKLHELVNTRGVDYIRNLFTFVGNHDKPRILHGLSLDMGLFHGKLGIEDENNNINYGLNRQNRIESMLQLTNSDSFAQLPLEVKLNLDNLDYFRTVSIRAVAMSKLIRSSINEVLPSIATPDEIKFLKEALLNLTNGNYLGSASNVKLNTINIPELANMEQALIYLLTKADVYLPTEEFQRVLNYANRQDIVEKYMIRGDFDWEYPNAHIGEANRGLAEYILRGASQDVPTGEEDYKKYSLYTVGLAALLQEAFLSVRGYDEQAKNKFFNATSDFVRKYDRKTVEENSEQLSLVETTEVAMAKNGYAARDISIVVEMLVAEAEYLAQKQGVLGEDEHFKNAEKIMTAVYENAVEPGAQKATMMMAFLSALVGIPTIYAGDEFGMSGYEEKAKNVYLQNRNALPWTELEEGPFKRFRKKIQKQMSEALAIRSRKDVDALNNGTPYLLETKGENDKEETGIPAFMMQDAYGNMTISLFNATGINPANRFDYFKALGIDEYNREYVFSTNDIDSINHRNRFVPIQLKKEIQEIVLGRGLSLPVDLEFKNSDLRDKATYVVRKFGDVYKIVNRNGGTIALNGVTAKNGVMVLKHVKKLAFKGNNINKQYNIVSNPYQKPVTEVKGEKLSIIK